jgi:hypothetical protein
MLIGGFANLVWGEPRTTIDLDITVDLEVFGAARFVDLLAEIGNPIVDDPLAFAERTRVMPVRTDGGVVVDFILATLPYERDAIARSVPMEIEGEQVSVCTPEDLILHKIVSTRARDHEDVVGVLRRQAGRLSIDWLDPIVEGLARDLDEPEIAERFRQAKRAANL